MEGLVHVFYTDNAPYTMSYHEQAYDIIHSMKFVPLIYRGITLATRRSNIDAEIRGDFYRSKIVVLLFGVGDGWRDVKDNWVLPELNYARSTEMHFLAYGTEEMKQVDVEDLGLPASCGTVGDEASFAKLLAKDLRRYN